MFPCLSYFQLLNCTKSITGRSSSLDYFTLLQETFNPHFGSHSVVDNVTLIRMKIAPMDVFCDVLWQQTKTAGCHDNPHPFYTSKRSETQSAERDPNLRPATSEVHESSTCLGLLHINRLWFAQTRHCTAAGGQIKNHPPSPRADKKQIHRNPEGNERGENPPCCSSTEPTQSQSGSIWPSWAIRTVLEEEEGK